MIDLNNQMSYPVMEIDIAARQLTLKEIGDESSSQIWSPTDSNSHRPPKFNRLTLIGFSHIATDGHHYYKYMCDCGNETLQRKGNVERGVVKSCGCYRRDVKTTHGHSRTKLHRAWLSMKSRCFYKRCKQYNSYGGRGITVCDERKDDFKAFYDWATTHGYEDSLEIDRIDNDGNYNPENCRWTTRKVNMNNKSNHVKINISGTEYRFSELADITDIKERTLRGRYQKGLRGSRLIKPVEKRR